MAYSSEIFRAFALSPIVFSEEQQELILANVDTRRKVFRILDIMSEMDPGDNVMKLQIAGMWLEIRKLLWPGSVPESSATP